MASERIALKVVDIDADGENEVVLCNDRLYAVLSPARGGRLIYLFARVPGGSGGALMIGNPTDDWNLQQELNRHMETPRNHPGALCDVGFEQDRYEVSAVSSDAGVAYAEMTNVQEDSPLSGARKLVLLTPDAPALVVLYETPEGSGPLRTEASLSPDYYRLLREGRERLDPIGGETWRGYRNGAAAVWVGLCPDEGTAWREEPARRSGPQDAGPPAHGALVGVEACGNKFHLLLGCGPTDDASCRRRLEEGRESLDRARKPAGEPEAESLEVLR